MNWTRSSGTNQPPTSFDTTLTAYTPNLLFCVFYAAVNYLPSYFLSTIWGYTYRHRLMGGIYEVRRRDGLRCYDIHIKFHNVWFRRSEVDGEGYTDTHTGRSSHKPSLGKWVKKLWKEVVVAQLSPLVRTVGVQAEIRTGHYPIVSQKCYYLRKQ
jgi:hypothetical protein